MAVLREAILEADADSRDAGHRPDRRRRRCSAAASTSSASRRAPIRWPSPRRSSKLLRVFPRLGKPVIAAVNGDALASGYALVCAADIAVTVDSARIGTFEASVGIWPMVAQVPPLQRLHPRHALENLLTGEPFDARRAYEIGIVNEVVGAGELWPPSSAGRSSACAPALRWPRVGAASTASASCPTTTRSSASLRSSAGMFTTTEHTIEAGERA